MDRNRVSSLLFLMVACICLSLLACQSNPPAPIPPAGAACKDEPFTYDDGPLGQNHWCGECNGNIGTTTPQAPINIKTSEAKPEDSLPELDFSGYKSTSLVTSKDPHNLKVSYKDGQSFLNIGGKPFKLDQFHFHRPGEEAVGNHRPAMVIHLVHNSVEPVVSGGAVAIAIMVEEGKPEPNTEALVNKLIQNFPPPMDGREANTMLISTPPTCSRCTVCPGTTATIATRDR